MTLTRGITSPCVKRAIASCSRQTLNAALAGQAEDFCFRTLADDHLGRPSRDLASRLLQGAAPRAVLSASLDLPQERALRRRLSNESRHLNQLARGAASGLERSVWSHAAAEALSDSALATLRMSEQVGALVAKLRPSAIVITHEGHVWERVVFAAAAQPAGDPEALAIGSV